MVNVKVMVTKLKRAGYMNQIGELTDLNTTNSYDFSGADMLDRAVNDTGLYKTTHSGWRTKNRDNIILVYKKMKKDERQDESDQTQKRNDYLEEHAAGSIGNRNDLLLVFDSATEYLDRNRSQSPIEVDDDEGGREENLNGSGRTPVRESKYTLGPKGFVQEVLDEKWEKQRKVLESRGVDLTNPDQAEAYFNQFASDAKILKEGTDRFLSVMRYHPQNPFGALLGSPRFQARLETRLAGEYQRDLVVVPRFRDTEHATELDRISRWGEPTEQEERAYRDFLTDMNGKIAKAIREQRENA